MKTEDKKKLDEEKRRLKRDQLLVEKARKEAGGSKCEECADTKARMAALKEELADKVKEELASDLKVEVEQLFDSGKVNLPARGEREDL